MAPSQSGTTRPRVALLGRHALRRAVAIVESRLSSAEMLSLSQLSAVQHTPLAGCLS
jgi:hypothetical protein